MSEITVKCRWPEGTKPLKCVGNISWLDFRVLIESVTNIPTTHQKILAGFPPKEVHLEPSAIISGVIRNGDTINISKSDSPTLVMPQTSSQPSTVSHESQSGWNEASLVSNDKSGEVKESKGEEVSRAMAEALEGHFESQSDYGQIVRRVMPDDNSCLFHTIAYVLEGERVAKTETLTRLRNVIAKAIRSDETTYDSATLGKSNAEYARWIVQPNSWGGAIELSILSKIYSAEIYALDVINGFGNCFGEDAGYQRRVYVIFDGIHYDAIALSPIVEEKELDLTEFKPWDQPIEKMALDFLLKEKSAGKFTDTQNFQILCQQCQTILIGEKGAAMHAMTTGHSQFVEKR